MKSPPNSNSAETKSSPSKPTATHKPKPTTPTTRNQPSSERRHHEQDQKPQPDEKLNVRHTGRTQIPHPGRIPRTQRTRTSRPKRHTNRKTASTRRRTQEIPLHQSQRQIKKQRLCRQKNVGIDNTSYNRFRRDSGCNPWGTNGTTTNTPRTQQEDHCQTEPPPAKTAGKKASKANAYARHATGTSKTTSHGSKTTSKTYDGAPTAPTKPTPEEARTEATPPARHPYAKAYTNSSKDQTKTATPDSPTSSANTATASASTPPTRQDPTPWHAASASPTSEAHAPQPPCTRKSSTSYAEPQNNSSTTRSKTK